MILLAWHCQGALDNILISKSMAEKKKSRIGANISIGIPVVMFILFSSSSRAAAAVVASVVAAAQEYCFGGI